MSSTVGDVLRGASATAAQLGDAWGHGVAEEMLGWAEISARRYGEAGRHLYTALAVDVLGPLRAAAVEGLAQIAAARRDLDRALRLLGISQRMLADFKTRCAPPVAARSADLEAKLRAAVGSRRATEMLAQGYELDLAQGLTYARGAGLPQKPSGGAPLSARELEVARLVADGLTTQEIAPAPESLRADRGEPPRPCVQEDRAELAHQAGPLGSESKHRRGRTLKSVHVPQWLGERPGRGRGRDARVHRAGWLERDRPWPVVRPAVGGSCIYRRWLAPGASPATRGPV